MNGLFVSTQMFQDEQVLLNLDAHAGGEILRLPPGTVPFGEELAFRRDEIEAVDETFPDRAGDFVQTALGHGDLLVQTPSDGRSKIADL